MRIAICGSGGLGREVAPLALAQVRTMLGEVVDPVVFVPKDSADRAPVAGLPSLPLSELADDQAVIAAVGQASRRRQILDHEGAGRAIASVMADTVRRRGRSEIGEGAILCDGVVITDGVTIGRGFVANPHACVMHDCTVGDFVTLAAGARLSGGVVVEDDVWIGAGAVIKQGVRIGRGATIGMGAVVIHDVAASTVVVGNPARPLER